jgi:hypothetical protein
MFVNKIEDLVIYNIALELAKEIHELTEKIPHNVCSICDV